MKKRIIASAVCLSLFISVAAASLCAGFNLGSLLGGIAVGVLVDSYGTGKLPDGELSELVRRCFDLRPAAIIERLDLRRPIYQATASYGHFGRPDLDLPWERLDAELK